CQQYNSLPLTC
nr:immunoglobulin light chain junction region [Macaca mulatta]MPO01597.1 immunoglobulin light chain junction region [Macaca mulatta]